MHVLLSSTASEAPLKCRGGRTEVSERVDPPLDGRLHTELLKRQHDAYVRRDSGINNWITEQNTCTNRVFI